MREIFDLEGELSICEVCSEIGSLRDVLLDGTRQIGMVCKKHGLRWAWQPTGAIPPRIRWHASDEESGPIVPQTEQGSRVQAPVQAVYEYLESWAGEELSPAFAERMANAPMYQLLELRDGWPRVGWLLEQPSSIDAMPQGALRPVVPGWQGQKFMMDTATRLLLYVPSVVVEASVLAPKLWHPRHEVDRRVVHKVLNRLATLRPLILDGSIQFAGQVRGRIREGSFRDMEVLKGVPLQDWDHYSRGLTTGGGWMLARRLAVSLLLVEEGKATPLALNRNEEIVFEALLSGHRVDGRISQLNTLARLSVPDFGADASALVRLRASGDAFAAWREHLVEALRFIEVVPESPAALAEARAVLSNELETRLALVRKDIDRSPALGAMQAGVNRLGFSGIGTMTSAAGASLLATGDLVASASIGLAGAMSANLAQGIIEYLKARRAQRESAAIWDVAMSFQRGHEEATLF